MANVRRLAELGMVPELAKEVARQIDASAPNAVRLVALSMVPELSREVARQIGTGTGDARRLAELGMVTVLAKEVAAQVGSGLPAMTASASPSPATAGSLVTVTFSVAPDSVSTSPSYAMSGSGTTRTFTPTADGVVTINAAKAGYSFAPLALTVGAAPATGILSVAADGWRLGWNGTPPTLVTDKPVTVLTPGFDATGAAVTKTRTVRTTKRIRQPYPAQASLSAADVAASDWIYAGDTIVGVANNSTLVPLAPLGRWMIFDGITIGNTLLAEIYATSLHMINQHPAACVEFIASDGTNTVTQKVSVLSLSTNPHDKNPLPCYRYPLDITSLTAVDGAGQIHVTLNAKIYPHYGTAAQIHDSAAANVVGGLRTLHFEKNVAKAANPPLAYLSQTLGTTSGVVSTDPAVAKAAPFSTYESAKNALAAATGITGGRLDGCVIRLMEDYTIQAVGGSFSRACRITGLTIESDPDLVAPATLTSFSGSARIGISGEQAPGVDAVTLRFRNVNVMRGSTSQITNNGVPMKLVLENIAFDNNAQNTAIIGTMGAGIWWMGVAISNWQSGPGAGGATGAAMLVRGCSGNLNGVRLEILGMFSCNFDNIGTGSVFGGRAQENIICAYNKFLRRANTNSLMEAQPSAVGAAFEGNLLEWTGENPYPAMRISGDGGGASTVGIIIRGNTNAGFDDAARWNNFYDEADYARFHTLFCCEGNLTTSRMATKGDVFREDGTRQGNWSYSYSVNCNYNFVGTLTQSPKDFNGIGTVIHSAYNGYLDPMFVDAKQVYKLVLEDAAPFYPGAGGGDYRLQSGSPARTIVATSVMKYDIKGNVRPATNDAAGCYAAAAAAA